MKSFAGFPKGKVRLTPVPDLFFAELLPAIDDLAEIKLTLFMFWYLHRQTGYPRYMTLDELLAEGPLLAALQGLGAEPAATLRGAVERAAARGTLLRLVVGDNQGEVVYLFGNTPQGRQAVEEARRGELLLERAGHVREPHAEDLRPSIFRLYEDNIGLLTPLMAEELTLAADQYPEQWLEDALRIAVESNVRNWRYVRGILERWEREGRDEANAPKNKRRM
jgi:DNA replication protein